MYPFITLLWDPSDLEAHAAAGRLFACISRGLAKYHSALRTDGFVVLHEPPQDDAMRAYFLPSRSGVIVGRVFPSDLHGWTPGWSWLPSEREADEIIGSKGRWLTQRMWGGYIAFLRDPRGTDAWVIRDCSGKLPCYRTRRFRVDILFSDPADLCALGLISSSIDWNYVCHFLCSSQMQVRQTALQGVTELLAGDCFHRPPKGESAQYCAWTPSTVLAQPPLANFDAAVAAVRHTAGRCVDAWASVYDRIVHQLSGGLDSAVVLGCLTRAQTPRDVLCVNRSGISGAEDEREFARLAASTAKVPLIEIPIIASDQVIDDALSRLPVTAKPTIPGTLGVLEIPLRNELTTRFRATSIWSGQGGDHLFIQTSAPFGLLDYAALNGLRPGLLRCLRDAADLSKANYWRTASLLWKRNHIPLASALGEQAVARIPFITEDVRSRVRDQPWVHPWLTTVDSMAPGQQLQVTGLAQVLNRHRPLPGVEMVYEHHPLLSQPLFELCLRIPSYVHLNGGIDRAVERAAFADVIPSRIAMRRSKGQSTFSILDIIHRSSEYLSDALLSGILVDRGILDRNAIEPFVRMQRPVDVTTFFPLITCIAAELWARNILNSRSNSPGLGGYTHPVPFRPSDTSATS
jgi:asparagine synthase (glutamine-hydrolysing)